MVKNSPANAGDTGSISDPGRPYMPQDLCATTPEPAFLRPEATATEPCVPARQAPAAVRSPSAAGKVKYIDRSLKKDTNSQCSLQNSVLGLPWQWLRCYTSTPGGAGSIRGLGPKILHATQPGHKKVKSLLCKSVGLEPPPQEPNPGSVLSFRQSFLTVSLEYSTTPITSAAL